MAIIKCKMCGGDLALVEGSVIAECEYCGTTQTVPAADDEKKLILFERAERLRRSCEFDKASGVYETIVADFRTEPEAYWGLVLCKYGIEYVDDPATGKKVPTCHRSSFESVMDDENFEQTLENADAVALKLYREEAKKIEEIRKGILEVSSSEDPYDIFICYKETDENGDRTVDSLLAQDIYNALTEKGYRVFFSRITLEDKLGQAYEPYIFAALNSAKIMLAVGTCYEYYNAVWVKNEWSRYLKIIAQDSTKYLLPCYKNIDAYDIPKEFAHLQGQDMGKVGAMPDLLRGIEKLIKATDAQPTQKEKGIDIPNLLKQGNNALEEKRWKLAARHFDMALLADPQCAEAYVGKLLTSYKIKSLKFLPRKAKRLNKDENFQEALRCSNDSLQAELKTCAKKTKQVRLRKALTKIAVTISMVLLLWLGLETAIRVTEDFYVTDQLATEYASQIFSALDWYGKPSEEVRYLLAVCTDDAQTANTLRPTRLRLSSYKLTCLSNNLSDLAEIPAVTEIEITDNVETLDTIALRLFPEMTSLIVPESVTFISKTTLDNCANLALQTYGNAKYFGPLNNPYRFLICVESKEITSCEIHPDTQSISTNAFADCAALASVAIPNNVTYIGASAFSGCASLVSVVIPNSVNAIARHAFKDCSALTSVTLPESVSYIGDSAFNNCTSLTEIILPDSISGIGSHAFLNCSNLVSVNIPNSVTAIEPSTFYGCTGLTSITLPQGIATIGQYAFVDCSNLTSIVIPDNVTTIELNAFKGCAGLTEITIPGSVTELDAGIFSNCTGLRKIYCAAPTQPEDWVSPWNLNCSAEVIWGATS